MAVMPGVAAVNKEGTSAFSPSLTATTSCGAPEHPPPTSVRATEVGGIRIRIEWDPPAEVNGAAVTAYCVERDDGAGGDFVVAYDGRNPT